MVDRTVVGARPEGRGSAAQLEEPTFRVLHVIDSLGVGGAEQLLVRLATQARSSRFRVAVATLRESESPLLPSRLHEADVDLTVFRITSPSQGLRFRPREIARLVRFVRAGGFDLVHTHLKSSNVVGVLAARLAGVPVVSTLHSVWRDDAARRRDRVRLRFLTAAGAELIAVGRAVADTHAEVLRGRPVVVLPNPAPRVTPTRSRDEVRAELGVGRNAPVALAIGRLVPLKNHDLLLHAMRRVLAQSPEARLWIVGRGPLAETLEQEIETLGLGHAVRLLGQRGDVPDLLHAADLVVNSSAWEGMPLSLLEAMAAGRCVVATDVGDSRHVLGEAGSLVPAGDPDALAAAMLALIEDPDRRRVAAEHAKRRAVEQFGEEQWINRLAETYDRVLSGRHEAS